MNDKEIDLRRVRQVIQNLVDEDVRALAKADNARSIFPTAINPIEGSSLRDWIVNEDAHDTIEIGLAYGFATLFICEGLITNGRDRASHVAIDPFQDGFDNAGLGALERAGVSEIVEFHQEESQIVLPRFVEQKRIFDFAFVDGSHFFERVFLDLVYLNRLVGPGKVVFVDDYQLPAIAKSAGFCISNFGWKLEELSEADALHQWAILRLPSVPTARTFRDFVDF